MPTKNTRCTEGTGHESDNRGYFPRPAFSNAQQPDQAYFIPARLTSLNIPAEVLIDDVYRANQARLLQSCSFAGQVDPDIMGEILWALCQSPGVPGIYCMALEQIALQLAPEGGQP